MAENTGVKTELEKYAEEALRRKRLLKASIKKLEEAGS